MRTAGHVDPGGVYEPSDLEPVDECNQVARESVEVGAGTHKPARLCFAEGLVDVVFEPSESVRDVGVGGMVGVCGLGGQCGE